MTRTRAMLTRRLLSCLLATALLCPTAAGAGGLARPNTFGPLGLGLGGAGFAGVPNPSTLHFNPAGLTLMTHSEAMGGVELVTAPRYYEPLDGSAREESHFELIPVPSLGLSTRLAAKGGKQPLPVAFGLAFYNTFGGAVGFDEAVVKEGIITSSILLLEIVPAVALELTSRLSVGAGLRIGIGTFHIVSNEVDLPRIAQSNISGSGTTVGLSLGATYQPLDWLRVGVVWASPMSVEMKGDGKTEVTPGAPWRPDLVTLEFPWPQWVGFGVALNLGSFNLYTGAKWIDWSSFDELVIDLNVISDVIEDLNFDDGFSLHLGLEYEISPRFAARAGLAFDSNTIPDKSMERQYLDAPKVTAALGGSMRVWGNLTLDLAYEILAGPVREVPSEKVVNPDTGLPEETNAAPGSYASMVHSIALGVRYRY